jgi:hypothetical protein
MKAEGRGAHVAGATGLCTSHAFELLFLLPLLFLDFSMSARPLACFPFSRPSPFGNAKAVHLECLAFPSAAFVVQSRNAHVPSVLEFFAVIDKPTAMLEFVRSMAFIYVLVLS